MASMRGIQKQRCIDDHWVNQETALTQIFAKMV